jgi:hypothetical protein
MPKLMLEINLDLYRLLQQAARSNAVSLEDECQRRLDGGVRRSRHIETLLAEQKATGEQVQKNRRKFRRAEHYLRTSSAW